MTEYMDQDYMDDTIELDAEQDVQDTLDKLNGECDTVRIVDITKQVETFGVIGHLLRGIDKADIKMKTSYLKKDWKEYKEKMIRNLLDVYGISYYNLFTPIK